MQKTTQKSGIPSSQSSVHSLCFVAAAEPTDNNKLCTDRGLKGPVLYFTFQIFVLLLGLRTGHAKFKKMTQQKTITAYLALCLQPRLNSRTL